MNLFRDVRHSVLFKVLGSLKRYQEVRNGLFFRVLCCGCIKW